jgi:hypothetical protein
MILTGIQSINKVEIAHHFKFSSSFATSTPRFIHPRFGWPSGWGLYVLVFGASQDFLPIRASGEVKGPSKTQFGARPVPNSADLAWREFVRAVCSTFVHYAQINRFGTMKTNDLNCGVVFHSPRFQRQFHLPGPSALSRWDLPLAWRRTQAWSPIRVQPDSN